jgi:hypothetical protein
LKLFYAVIMVRGWRMSRRWGVEGRGMPPPSTSTPEGYSPHGEENTIEQECVAVDNMSWV